MEDILNRVFFGNSVEQYVRAVAIAVLGCLVVRIAFRMVIKKLGSLSERTNTTLDDFLVRLLKKIGYPLGSFWMIYLGVRSLTLPETLERVFGVLVIGITTIYVVRIVLLLTKYALDVYVRKSGGDITLAKSFEVLFNFGRVMVWGVALIFFLDNLGFKISTFIAGLGIGGLAVGFAAQAVLKDLLSFFSIIIDRPFAVGDFIIVGDLMGVVEHIGIVSTRITSLGGEQLVFSNTDLTSSRLRNYKKMQRRRVVFKLGVVYQTPAEKVRAIPGMVTEIIKKVPDTVFDRAHFFSYGDFSLVYEVVYYVQSGDYNTYMDIQQEINFGIMDAFVKRGIEFAYPTQTLFVNKEERPVAS